jgi:hypothetical protein
MKGPTTQSDLGPAVSPRFISQPYEPVAQRRGRRFTCHHPVLILCPKPCSLACHAPHVLSERRHPVASAGGGSRRYVCGRFVPWAEVCTWLAFFVTRCGRGIGRLPISRDFQESTKIQLTRHGLEILMLIPRPRTVRPEIPLRKLFPSVSPACLRVQAKQVSIRTILLIPSTFLMLLGLKTNTSSGPFRSANLYSNT